jgi:hypothetical protein
MTWGWSNTGVNANECFWSLDFFQVNGPARFTNMPKVTMPEPDPAGARYGVIVVSLAWFLIQ